MPRQISCGHRLFRALALFARGLFEVFVEKPRSRCPDVAVFARLTHAGCDLNGLGKILVEILAHDTGLGVCKPHVQMALEHHQHSLDLARGRLRRQAMYHDWLAGQRPSGHQQVFYELSPFHNSVSAFLSNKLRGCPWFSFHNLTRRGFYTLPPPFASPKISFRIILGIERSWVFVQTQKTGRFSYLTGS